MSKEILLRPARVTDQKEKKRICHHLPDKSLEDLGHAARRAYSEHSDLLVHREVEKSDFSKDGRRGELKMYKPANQVKAFCSGWAVLV
ncbi:hypothetical protein SERLA73DRAFT_136028 [Serpula lacrymans var. lacrymans S7.3]|uniref:Uncharacterized protein n=2 Tax=Serpula lacrymans var. lacrymans TaxID=341189 RepID=F8PW92_SERL3|nr:uncharacterized protein SERLADRAFT_388350 [Serpula lacrymans var. lacrymans S7.9]EGO00268.1 hypothetical protein SERLA73DRAFT_136028 [Serpula lacrymans var. lacrymans S7.3]EGO25823.1 hypothetical protein SERLADRAFT_388350 [Serpula lacrymans var. lacrymans S7.9]